MILTAENVSLVIQLTLFPIVNLVFQGKPLAEAAAEVASGASFFEWYSEIARHINGDVIEAPAKGRQIFALKEPLGVAGMITPVRLFGWHPTKMLI